MSWEFNTKRFLKSLAGYVVILIVLDMILSRYTSLVEPKKSIIQIFLAVMVVQVIEEVYRRYKTRA
ncbi:MAG: hypothetical protein RLZZ480_218 [Candidatus Parcubacteria bacterium]|jgi:hypothetical protein